MLFEPTVLYYVLLLLLLLAFAISFTATQTTLRSGLLSSDAIGSFPLDILSKLALGQREEMVFGGVDQSLVPVAIRQLFGIPGLSTCDPISLSLGCHEARCTPRTVATNVSEELKSAIIWPLSVYRK